MPSVNCISEWRPEIHGPRSDRWHVQEDFLPPCPVLGEGINNFRREMRTAGLDPVDCPCCGAMMKVYPVRLGKRHVVTLRALVRGYGIGELVDWKKAVADHGEVSEEEARTYSGGGGPPTHLGWWGLVEVVPPGDGEDKRTSGMCRTSQFSADFVNKKVAVPGFVYTFQGEIWGISATDVLIDEIETRRYKYYSETMNTEFPDGTDIHPGFPDLGSLEV